VRQELWIEEGRKIDERNIVAGPRINIDYAEEWKGTVLLFFFSSSSCTADGARTDTRLSLRHCVDAPDKPLRFHVKGNPHVSKPAFSNNKSPFRGGKKV
jgi:3-methyladenine DNA glycosylase Mpg